MKKEKKKGKVETVEAEVVYEPKPKKSMRRHKSSKKSNEKQSIKIKQTEKRIKTKVLKHSSTQKTRAKQAVWLKIKEAGMLLVLGGILAYILREIALALMFAAVLAILARAQWGGDQWN